MLKKNGVVVASEHTYGAVSCHQLLRFWGTWSDDTIAVGRGLLGQGQVLSWVDEDEPIIVTGVSMATGMDGDLAEWVIPKKQGAPATAV